MRKNKFEKQLAAIIRKHKDEYTITMLTNKNGEYSDLIVLFNNSAQGMIFGKGYAKDYNEGKAHQIATYFFSETTIDGKLFSKINFTSYTYVPYDILSYSGDKYKLYLKTLKNKKQKIIFEVNNKSLISFDIVNSKKPTKEDETIITTMKGLVFKYLYGRYELTENNFKKLKSIYTLSVNYFN